ncbi:hypothetical protein EVAR_89752_1 [Eumeta japonica]|uniref:Uncharacterized protein n=1 Tax=Eumeta variegata TaxID=151549 RepID=A0A4C1SM67_EUMVA|nr:hypothetical protein EVAR_89752_1 [Eumeta japonica]
MNPFKLQRIMDDGDHLHSNDSPARLILRNAIKIDRKVNISLENGEQSASNNNRSKVPSSGQRVVVSSVGVMSQTNLYTATDDVYRPANARKYRDKENNSYSA